MPGSYVLKLTSAIVIDGEVMKSGALVEVTEAEAKNLLSRGKAELHSEQPADESHFDLSKMNKGQLLEIADNLEIEGADKMNKAQLIEAIEAADNGQKGDKE